MKSAHDWKRVGREIRILKRLTNHPAVIHLLDVVTLPEEIYVVQVLRSRPPALSCASAADTISERRSRGVLC